MANTWPPFKVSYPVAMVYQYDNTSCWAAGIAMLAATDLDSVLGEHKGEAMTWERIEPIAQSYGLKEIFPACGLPNYWEQNLDQHGPIWVVLKLGTGHVSHAVVLHTVESDGTPDGTYCYYNDPISGPSQKSYPDFESTFEVGASSRANLFAMY
ncbi:MAG TPA: papain-like cysteine protease family protein [Acidimicrobiales bacterium]|nr:papain-like cysteine protease family protein [Acidimicrobiales bacterium]